MRNFIKFFTSYGLIAKTIAVIIPKIVIATSMIIKSKFFTFSLCTPISLSYSYIL